MNMRVHILDWVTVLFFVLLAAHSVVLGISANGNRQSSSKRSMMELGDQVLLMSGGKQPTLDQRGARVRPGFLFSRFSSPRISRPLVPEPVVAPHFEMPEIPKTFEEPKLDIPKFDETSFDLSHNADWPSILRSNDPGLESPNFESSQFDNPAVRAAIESHPSLKKYLKMEAYDPLSNQPASHDSSNSDSSASSRQTRQQKSPTIHNSDEDDTQTNLKSLSQGLDIVESEPEPDSEPERKSESDTEDKISDQRVQKESEEENDDDDELPDEHHGGGDSTDSEMDKRALMYDFETKRSDNQAKVPVIGLLFYLKMATIVGFIWTLMSVICWFRRKQSYHKLKEVVV